MTERFHVINKEISERGLKNYLEIGYQNGINFREIQCESKIAVDPNPFEFNTEYQYSMNKEQKDEFKKISLGGDLYKLVEVTSDEFFKKNEELFDCVFIDGLHDYKQVLKDFSNALDCTSEKAVIILHDTNPSSEERSISFSEGGQWNGDCFKLLEHLFYSGLQYYSYGFDQGITVVVKEGVRGVDFDFDDTPMESPIKFDYFNENRNEILKMVSDNQPVSN